MNNKSQKKGRRPVKELVMQKEASKSTNSRIQIPEKKSAAHKKATSEKSFKVIEGHKKETKKKRRILAIVFPTIVGVLILFVAIFNFSVPTGMIEWIGNNFALSGAGKGFPVFISGGNALGAAVHNNHMAVITDAMITELNSSGKIIYARPHSFSNPVIKVSEIRTIIYDRSGTEYRIENAQKTIYSGKTEKQIVTGTICDNGDYAIVTGSDDYAALVTVYNKDNNEKFRWSSTNKIISISLSNDGRKMSIAAIDSSSGEFKSIVYMFDLSKTEPTSKKEFIGELVMSINCDGGRTEILTDTRFLNMQYSGEISESFIIKDSLNFFDSVSGVGTVFNLSIHNNTENNKIVLLSTEGKKIVSFDFSKKVESVSASKDKIYVLSDKLYAYDFKGKLVNTFEIQGGAIYVKGYTDSAVVIYKNEIESYK